MLQPTPPIACGKIKVDMSNHDFGYPLPSTCPISEIISLEIDHPKYNALPGFMKEMTSLSSLEIVSSTGGEGQSPSPDDDDDPFHNVKFPETLASLTLTHTHLYQPFRKIKTLTKLVLCDYQFPYSLDILLDFLEGNPLLQHVELSISSVSSNSKWYMCKSKRENPIRLKDVELLSVTGIHYVDIKAMVSFISIPKDAVLKILPLNQTRHGQNHIPLGQFFKVIGNVTQPTYMYADYTNGHVKLSGPVRRIEVQGIDDDSMFRLLSYLASLDFIQKLHLIVQTPADLRPIHLPLLHNLKTLIIKVGVYTEITLSRSSISPATFLLAGIGAAPSWEIQGSIEKMWTSAHNVVELGLSGIPPQGRPFL